MTIQKNSVGEYAYEDDYVELTRYDNGTIRVVKLIEEDENVMEIDEELLTKIIAFNSATTRLVSLKK